MNEIFCSRVAGLRRIFLHPLVDAVIVTIIMIVAINLIYRAWMPWQTIAVKSLQRNSTELLATEEGPAKR